MAYVPRTTLNLLPRALSFRVQVNSSQSQLQRAIGLFASAYEGDNLVSTYIELQPGGTWTTQDRIKVLQVDTTATLSLESETPAASVVILEINRMAILDQELVGATLTNLNNTVARVNINYATPLTVTP